MQRNIRFATALVLAFATASPVSAQNYPDLDNVLQFTASANYMSQPGYLRWYYYLDSGRWSGRDSSCYPMQGQIGKVPTAPTNDTSGM